MLKRENVSLKLHENSWRVKVANVTHREKLQEHVNP